MRSLRAGLVGLGMMGRNHARVMSSLEGVELVAVADPRGDVHAAASGRPVLDSVKELIDFGIDYCVVVVPTQYHESVGLALADAGVHALIEKPLSANTESARRLVDAFSAAELVAAVGHIERYNPALQSARSRLENGDLGQVYQIVTRRQGPFPSRIADTGVVMDLASHDLDLTMWIANSPFKTVDAHTAYRSGRDTEDLLALLGILADGTITSHLVNWLSPLKERVTVITGERGAYVADTLTADLTFHSNGAAANGEWQELAQFRGVSEGDVIRYGIPRREPLRLEHESFRDAVLGDRRGIATLEDGLAVVAVAESALKSAVESQTVQVRLPA